MRSKSSSASGGKKSSDLSSLWEERIYGEELPEIDWNRPITHQDVAYLLQLYPYLQIISSEAVWEEEIIPRFRTAPSGWLIHDYGQAMSTSPGKYLFGEGNPELYQEGGEDGGEGGGSGAPNPHRSIITQSLLTTEAMVEFAMEKGWPGIEVVSGTSFMRWAIWMAAKDRAFTLVGYEPSDKEKKKRDRIVKIFGTKGVTLGMGVGPRQA